jgi:hypothetical protein
MRAAVSRQLKMAAWRSQLSWKLLGRTSNHFM